MLPVCRLSGHCPAPEKPTGTSWIADVSQRASDAESEADTSSSLPRGPYHGRIGNGGVLAGGRRCRVACSEANPILIRVGSPQARPSTCSPTGRLSRTNPIGTVIAGKPVGGDRRGLLFPCGVLRSPISRGGNAQVG